MNYQKIFEASSSIINNPVYMNSYMMNSVQLLTDIGITDAAEQQAVNEFLVPAADFRQIQVKTFKQRMDYDKKMQVLFDIVHNSQAAGAFEAAPVQFINSYGTFTPQEQQQLIDMLRPVKEFQQLQIKNREEAMNYKHKIACLKHVFQNKDNAEEYSSNPVLYMQQNGIISSEDQQEFIELVLPAQEAQKKFMEINFKQYKETLKVNSSYREGLSKTNEHTIRGFKQTMIMYNVSFYIGIALLITAVFFAFFIKSSLFTILFGSIGTLDLLTFFIANPPLRLQESRAEQAKLNAAFYSWFLDLYNWNSFYVQYSQKGEMINLEIMKQVSDSQIKNTRKLMEIISKHIDTKGKPSGEAKVNMV